jgi:hypothetical protein
MSDTKAQGRLEYEKLKAQAQETEKRHREEIAASKRVIERLLLDGQIAEAF